MHVAYAPGKWNNCIFFIYSWYFPKKRCQNRNIKDKVIKVSALRKYSRSLLRKLKTSIKSTPQNKNVTVQLSWLFPFLFYSLKKKIKNWISASECVTADVQVNMITREGPKHLCLRDEVWFWPNWRLNWRWGRQESKPGRTSSSGKQIQKHKTRSKTNKQATTGLRLIRWNRNPWLANDRKHTTTITFWRLMSNSWPRKHIDRK